MENRRVPGEVKKKNKIKGKMKKMKMITRTRISEVER